MGSKHKTTWKLLINGSSNFKGSGIFVVIMDDKYTIHEYSVYISFLMINNVSKYGTTIFGVMSFRKLGTHALILFSNSRLFIN